MIKKLFIFISFIFLLACEKEDCLVYYTHNGITITRLNLNNEIRFYYGKFTNKNKLPESYIQASSFDGFIQGYLIFRESGKVEIVKKTGVFKKINVKSELELVKFDNNVNYNSWVKKITGKYINIVQFSDLKKFELDRNIKNHSEVKIKWMCN